MAQDFAFERMLIYRIRIVSYRIVSTNWLQMRSNTPYAGVRYPIAGWRSSH